jgi:hypothetical protein
VLTDRRIDNAKTFCRDLIRFQQLGTP